MTEKDLHIMVGRIDANVTALLDAVPNLEKRMGKQERRSSWLTGGAFVLAAFAAKLGYPDLTFGILH